MAYAETTSVPIDRTRAEIERLLTKFACTQYIIGSDIEQRTAMVQFKAKNRIIRFLIPLPDPKDKKYTQNPRSPLFRRADSVIRTIVEQAERQRWRALYLVIKAKLESVESNIASFDEEFLAHIVLPNDRTVASVVLPLVERSYESGRVAGLLMPAHEEA